MRSKLFFGVFVVFVVVFLFFLFFFSSVGRAQTVTVQRPECAEVSNGNDVRNSVDGNYVPDGNVVEYAVVVVKYDVAGVNGLVSLPNDGGDVVNAVYGTVGGSSIVSVGSQVVPTIVG